MAHPDLERCTFTIIDAHACRFVSKRVLPSTIDERITDMRTPPVRLNISRIANLLLSRLCNLHGVTVVSGEFFVLREHEVCHDSTHGVAWTEIASHGTVDLHFGFCTLAPRVLPCVIATLF